MRTILTPILTLYLSIGFVSCTDGVPSQPDGIDDASHLLPFMPGDTVVWLRTAGWASGPLADSLFVTDIVVGRTEIDSVSTVLWNSGVRWRFTNGTFEKIAEDGTVSLWGKVPRDTGEWPEPTDTLQYIPPDEDSSITVLEYFETISMSDTIETPIGDYVCIALQARYYTNGRIPVRGFPIRNIWYNP